jgi:hypothetical protein
MTDKIASNDEDAILARADQIRTERAAAAQAEVQARFAPLITFKESPEFAAVAAKLEELAPGFIDQPAIYQNLTIMRRMMDAVGMSIPANVRVSA